MKKTSMLFGLCAALFAAAMMAVTSGCASGGYSLTRQYARWVNSQNVILRVIIYLLTGVVFAVTILIDVVVFNTMDFWQGKVSQGIYEFSGEGKTFLVEHRVQPETGRKQSVIQVRDGEGRDLQNVIIRELASGQIEMMVDGVRRALVDDVSTLPRVGHFDIHGKMVKESALWAELPMIPARFLVGR